jgi:hypothetical protein
MSTEQMALEMARRLNRPDADDLFAFPSEYYNALSQAHRYYYRLFAGHRPRLIYTSATLTSSDGGDTFLLTDDHYGEMELYRSPGPPNGRPLVPSNPEGSGHYYQEGRTITMITPYSNTLYLRWVPATVADLDEDNDSLLPAYADDAIIEWACYLLAQKPGFLGNPEVYMANSLREWAGDPNNPADMGVLGIISRQSSHQAWEGADETDGPWWRGIPT